MTEHEGNGYNVAGTWDIVRSPSPTRVMLDFAGLDGDGNLLPVEQSYACHVRMAPTIDVYFAKRGGPGSDRRARWQAQLATFVTGIEHVVAEEPPLT